MKEITSKEHKHLIWKDELNDTFLITKHCEIFKYSDNILGLYVWSRKMHHFLQLHKNEVIKHDSYMDEGFTLYHVKRSFLGSILALAPRFLRRPNVDGKWINRKKELLGHDIIKFGGDLT